MAISNPFLYLADRSIDLFFIYDLKNARFSYMNPSCLSFFNLGTTDVDLKLLLKFIHKDDRRYVLSKLNECINGQQISDVECRMKPGKDLLWLRIKPSIFTEEGDSLIIGQAEDITTYKENTDVLNNHNIKKNSILGILTHDLAGPIGTINNLSALLTKETAAYTNPRVDQYVQLISKISKSSLKLIRDFLDREFLESAGAALFKKRVELIEKITLVVEDFLAMQKELNINFSCTSEEESVYVEIDEDKFMQVIVNLISNSLKFTHDGGNIKIHVKDNKKHILISVADDGIGIPRKYHATLFDQFSSARRSGLKGEPSTGLGMSIIKAIVDWHKGKIWFESQENKGTTFYIQLPKS